MLISLALRDPNWCQVSSGPLRNLSKAVAMRKCCDLQALADEICHSQRLARKDTTGSTTPVRCLSRWWAPREADNPRKFVQKDRQTAASVRDWHSAESASAEMQSPSAARWSISTQPGNCSIVAPFPGRTSFDPGFVRRPQCRAKYSSTHWNLMAAPSSVLANAKMLSTQQRRLRALSQSCKFGQSGGKLLLSEVAGSNQCLHEQSASFSESIGSANPRKATESSGTQSLRMSSGQSA
jgi:hypothetical protein